MLDLTKKHTQPRAIAVIVALLTGCTFVMDRVVAFAMRPYLQDWYNAVIVKRTKVPTAQEVADILYFLNLYYLAVYHFFVLISVLMVFIHPKFRPFKRELLYAYLIILTAQAVWVIARLVSLKML